MSLPQKHRAVFSLMDVAPRRKRTIVIHRCLMTNQVVKTSAIFKKSTCVRCVTERIQEYGLPHLPDEDPVRNWCNYRLVPGRHGGVRRAGPGLLRLPLEVDKVCCALDDRQVRARRYTHVYAVVGVLLANANVDDLLRMKRVRADRRMNEWWVSPFD